MMVEKELKCVLSEDEYVRFRSFLKEKNIELQKSIFQINYYIDTNELLFSRKGISVRIRKIVGERNNYEFTMKTPSREFGGNGIKVKNEISIDLEEEVAEALLKYGKFIDYENIIKPVFEEAGVTVDFAMLSILGELKTTREFYLIDPRFEPLNIDISSYFDIIDYEIEWETDKVHEVAEIILGIFEKINIKLKDHAVSKIGRFFSAYRTIEYFSHKENIKE
jgi:uncharacterized protein YjbK